MLILYCPGRTLFTISTRTWVGAPACRVWLNIAFHPMDEARIAELLRPFLSEELSSQQLRYISIYINILLKWNQRMNLTAVRQPEQVVTRHFGESLFVAQALFPDRVGAAAFGRPIGRSLATQARAPFDFAQGKPGAVSREAAGKGPIVVDVGSGAGFPGLPIKIWAPEIRLTLVESNHKKATFLKEVVRALGLKGVDVFVGRAESFPAGSADVVTMRAVERFEDILPITAALLKPGGRLALLIGNSRIERAKTAVKEMTWQVSVLVPLSNHRVLLSGYRG